MVSSALNFAIGFFGYPIEDKYQQSIIIEAPGVRILRLWKLLAHELKLMIYSSITLLLPIKRTYSYLSFVLYLIFLL
jgi:hypothetical protein